MIMIDAVNHNRTDYTDCTDFLFRDFYEIIYQCRLVKAESLIIISVGQRPTN